MHSTILHYVVVCALLFIFELWDPVLVDASHGAMAASTQVTVDEKLVPGLDQPAATLVTKNALRRRLATAVQNIIDGRIHLNLDQPVMPLASGVPICSGPDACPTHVRVRVGQTALFSCPLDRCPSDHDTCPDQGHLLWRHKKHSVWHVLCQGSTAPFQYSQSRTSTTDYLLIHNVTVEATGGVYCLCRGWNNTGLCVNEAYQLTPISTPTDVLETPVLNVTSPAGRNVTLISKLRIRFHEHTDHRYIVRYNGFIVFAPTSHPVHALTETIFPHCIHLALSDDNVTITIPYLPQSFSGQFEVWVRPIMGQDEFVLQTINLQLI